MFRRAASLVDFQPQDGQEVELRGRLAVYEPRGELQLIVEGMRRAGAGALMEQFLRLKARLEAEGLFDPSIKRPLPAMPRRVGIVTSLAAAALRDVVSALARRSPQVELIIYPAPVQGADAGALLAQAIALAGARAEVDVLLVCRGGGSLEDLWAFNDERVVRAIAASPVPVVSGVGHETDFTPGRLRRRPACAYAHGGGRAGRAGPGRGCSMSWISWRAWRVCVCTTGSTARRSASTTSRCAWRARATRCGATARAWRCWTSACSGHCRRT